VAKKSIEDELEAVARKFLDKAKELAVYSDPERLADAQGLAYAAAKLIEVSQGIRVTSA